MSNDSAFDIALTSAATSAGVFPEIDQSIAYNAFDKVSSITEGNQMLQINYGHHRQRIGQQYTAAGITTTKVYAGACEYITKNGQTTIHTYLSGSEGIFALHVKNPNGTESTRYIHKDHLGSWNTITDENGNLLQELSFDAWGNRRNPATWRAFTDKIAAALFDRGFTGHEHLYGFRLINMNGRMYDPVVSRMLSPDNFVQAPDFSQSFNRYSYCWNNPLVYTDPSGEFIVSAIIIGAFINATIQVATGNVNDMGDFFTAIGIGALSGAAGGIAGNAVAGIAGGGMGAASGALSGSAGGFAGGFVGGAGNAWASGSNLGQGIRQGIIGGGFGAITGGLIGGLQGGINASRNGFDFWTGKGVSISEMSATATLPTNKGELTNINTSQQLTEHTFQNYANSEEYVQGVYKGVERFHLAQQRGYYVENGLMFNATGEGVHGITVNVRASTFGGGKSFIGVSPNMITYSNNLHAVLGHELIHAYHYSTGFISRFGREASEHYALKFSASVSHSTQFGAQISYQTYSIKIPFSHSYVYPPWVSVFY